jgi:16S rRNA (guanine527-N7)-methyltransferase
MVEVPVDAAELARNRAEALNLVPVSRETSERLDHFIALLLEGRLRANLVASSTLPQVWTRHVADSAQLLRLAPEAKCWIDLGSGAGFPGLVIACALADRPGAAVHLVESTGKKCAFLRGVIQQLSLPATVHEQRIEQFASDFNGPFDVVTARAVAPLVRLLGLAAPLLKSRGIGLFPKGQDVAAELTEASKCWKFDSDIEPSVTSPASGILVIRNLRAQSAAPARR